MRPSCVVVAAALCALRVLAPVPVLAAESALAGRWEGAIELPGQKLEVVIDLALDAAGTWSGTIDIPAQTAEDIPLKGFEVQPPKVRFGIAGPPGDPTFDGEIAPDGTSLSGTFRQGGGEFAFRLERGGARAGKAKGALADPAALVRPILEKFRVPSAGVAVVVADEIVLAEGFGLRDVEAKLPATGDSLYAIGSVTKSFTAASVAVLANEGKLRFDQPVAELLPEFRLADPARTMEVTVRDLLSHRTGLPRHDLGWYGLTSEVGRDELVRRLRFLDANAPLRERWQYQNWMFTTAGYLAGRLAGTSWEDLVRTRLLAPLGMARTNFSTEVSAKDPDHAWPYEEVDGTIERVPFRELPAMGPAGTINSSARDMAAWLRLHLGRGKLGEEQLLAESVLTELHAPAMIIAESSPDPEILAPRYALGWFTDVYRGHRRIHHGGNIDGFSALVTFFPDDDVGIVVLANLGGTPAPGVITSSLADRLLDLRAVDWLERVGGRWDQGRAAASAAQGRAEELRRPGTKPPRPLEEYAGEYEHPGYGVLTVGRGADDTLAATIHGLTLPLEHWHFEVFRASSTEKSLSELKLFLQFVPDDSGEIVRLEAPFEALLPPIRFRKLPPARLSDPGFLAMLTGEYVPDAAPSQVAKVELAGKALNLRVPGQPLFALTPLRGTEFALSGVEGFRVRFVLDGDTVREVLFLQPDGVYSAKRRK